MNKKSKLQAALLIICIVCSFLISACNQVNTNKRKTLTFTVEKVTQLPKELTESSGIIFYDSLVWSFNDGGHGSILYAMHINSGRIKKEIDVPDASNVDWEDITQDPSSIYIGDFGNNWGNRKDLCIYKVSKSHLNKKKKGIKVRRISFSYPDQKNFTYKFEDTPFDCEAFVCIGDSLLLFTKNWKTRQSVIYSVPAYPGDYIAHRIGEFNSKGLVTGADYYPITDQIALSGHKNHIPFVILIKLEDLLNNNDNYDRFELKDLYGIQIEGIAFYDNIIYLSSEKSVKMPELFRLTVK